MKEDIKILEELKEEYSKGLERLNDKDLSWCMQNIYTLRKKQVQAIESLITENKKLKQENEEWQRAYQEEKDKQFELLRENKELKDRIKDFLKNKGVTDIQITAIKHQGYIEGFAQRDKLARELCEDCRKTEKSLRYIPKSKVKEKIEEYKKNIDIAQGEELLMLDSKVDVLEELLREE